MSDYFESGFAVREPMWHGKGLILDDYPTDWDDARRKAGLLWEPIEEKSWVARPVAEIVCVGCSRQLGDLHAEGCPVYAQDLSSFSVRGNQTGYSGLVVPSKGGGTVFVEDVEHKQIVRSDTKAVLGAGLSQHYQIITHGADAANGGGSMEQILDAFSNADGHVKFETAGSVKGGRQVWALIYLDEPFQVNGDPSLTIPYIALLNSHDGTGACNVVRTQVRVVCANTYQMALADGKKRGLSYSFGHKGDPGARIEEAKIALSGLRNEVDEYKALAHDLSNLRVSSTNLEEFLTDFIPDPSDEGRPASDRVKNNVEKARDKFREIYSYSITTDGIRGTGYGLFQAGTEYLDHVRGFRSQDTYLGRSILSADKAKGFLLPMVKEHASV